MAQDEHANDTEAERHELQYNPRRAIGAVQPYFDRATAASLAARRSLKAELDVRYGERALMTCDIFPAAEPGAPVHVFIHGGYWRGRDKGDYSFIADTLVAEGVTTVIANYDLSPEVTLPTIVAEMIALFDWLPGAVGRYNGDPKRITASGHSAGAHLIAMANSPEMTPAVPNRRIRSAVLISGLYDLEPVLKVSVNEVLGLTASLAEAMSPLHHLPPSCLPLDVVVGGGETEAWIDQSRRFVEALEAAGGKPAYEVLDAHNHYSIMEELMRPDSRLTRLIVERARAA